ncbi:hypothetical protein EYC80_005040 [Monilinia laxa]|uniref:Uncharacterized protein n=1 Tax=Monilinia laxa TaxID=61186 RepID=A0A5N6KIP6_MONLA|nr:hypothetical protein EYC80_005040 [Monilinia laxa]
MQSTQYRQYVKPTNDAFALSYVPTRIFHRQHQKKVFPSNQRSNQRSNQPNNYSPSPLQRPISIPIPIPRPQIPSTHYPSVLHCTVISGTTSSSTPKLLYEHQRSTTFPFQTSKAQITPATPPIT